MTRLTRFMAVTALVIASMSGSAAVAQGSPPNPPPGLPVYLALGDSIANGENSDAPQDIDGYWAAVAQWRQDGYVTPFRSYLKTNLDCLPVATDRAADGCRQLQLINLARSAIPAFGTESGKPGVTSQLFIDEQLTPAENLLRARNDDDNPRNDVEVVTITVGGNEIFDAFMSGDPSQLASALERFIANYHTILGGLRDAAGPETPIITMTYFNPLPYCGYPYPDQGAVLGNLVLEQLPTPAGNGLNGIIRNISAQYGATPAEGFGILGSGDFANCKHPNETGYTKLATAFEQAWTLATR